VTWPKPAVFRSQRRRISSPVCVSQQIRSLEERYGRELVERSKGHVRLTQAGDVLYQAGKEIIQKYREIEDSLQTLSRTSPARCG